MTDQPKPKRIAISAGHHNWSGGNHTEVKLVGPIVKALAAHCRERGFDVRVITPDEGLGTFAGGLRDVAQKVVQWAKEGWVADVFMEVHGEDNGQGDNGRGCFVIFPGVDGDTDGIVRDWLGPKIARAIRDRTGIPLRSGTGIMSERQTYVYTQLGARLGIFQVTAKLLPYTRRMILEVGAYSSPSDSAIMAKPDFPAKCAGAIAEALGEFFKVPEPKRIRWFRVAVDAARTREGPGTQYSDALQGEALLHNNDVFAVDEIVLGEKINGNTNWVHRADQIGFVSAALLEEVQP